jgi:hypothetical protein
MRKNIYILFSIIILLLNSCSSYKVASTNVVSENSNFAKNDFYGGKEYSTSNSENLYFENVEDRKIIYNATLSLTVKIPDSTNVEIVEIAEKYEGYVQSVGTNLTKIRVKSENLNKAIEEISLLGKIESKSISGEDVTDEYTDYVIRLENAEKARTRYLELLALAANVTETLLVEKELERLNSEIELLKGKMSKIEHLTEYSTITIYLKEKVKPGIAGYFFIGVYKVVKWLFVRN